MIWVVFLAFPALLVLLGLIFRPWYIHRGMTTEEWKAFWPGDNIVAGALPSGSRAMVTHAPAAEVWTWITQIGQDRAGFYSYRILENLAGAQMPYVKGKRKEWSTREAGQSLIMAPPNRFGRIAVMEIAEAVDTHYFVANNFEGTWAFIVEPIDTFHCRLIARGMWLPSSNPVARFAHSAIFDLVHYFMEWKMVREVKRLAESSFEENVRQCQSNS
jgi:hypothetical protein